MARVGDHYWAIWAGRRFNLFRENSRGPYINDLRPGDKIPAVLGCDGTIHLHFGDNEIPYWIFCGFRNDGVFCSNPECDFTK